MIDSPANERAAGDRHSNVHNDLLHVSGEEMICSGSTPLSLSRPNS